MKRVFKVIFCIGIITIVAAILASPGCSISGTSPDPEQSNTVKVTRGDLMSIVSAIGNVSMPDQLQLTFGSGSATNEMYTVEEINVEFGDTVKQGDLLARLDTSSLEREVKKKEADLRTAEINLEQAKSETAQLRARAAVESAEVTLAKAREELEEAKTTDIVNAEASVRDAQVQLETAKTSLEATQLDAEQMIDNAEDAVNTTRQAYIQYLTNHMYELTVASIAAEKEELYEDYLRAQENVQIARSEAENALAVARNNVAKAKDALRQAEEALADVQIGSAAYQQKEVAVAQAEANLSQAKDDLAYIEAGLDIELLELSVESAKAALEEAQGQLDSAVIVAPFDGVVAAVYADVGDKVTPNQAIIYLVNTANIRIDASVDEIDVLTVKTGQTALVEFDALPDARLHGVVSAISPVATSQASIVTYPITIEVQKSESLELKEGMSATITIITVQAQDVLLVPSEAVRQEPDGAIVEVMNSDGSTEERPVEVGATNGIHTEIVSGLSEGELVIVADNNIDRYEIMETIRQQGGLKRFGDGMQPGPGIPPPM